MKNYKRIVIFAAAALMLTASVSVAAISANARRTGKAFGCEMKECPVKPGEKMHRERPGFDEEKKAEMEAKFEQMKEERLKELSEKLEKGEITQKEYDKLIKMPQKGKMMPRGEMGKKMPEISEEKKAEMEAKFEQMKEERLKELSEKLEKGEITQEEYDKCLDMLKNGREMGRMGRPYFNGKKPECEKTEE